MVVIVIVVVTSDHLLDVILRDPLLAAEYLPEVLLLNLSRVVRVKQAEDLSEGVLVRLSPPLDRDELEILIETHRVTSHVHRDRPGHGLGLHQTSHFNFRIFPVKNCPGGCQYVIYYPTLVLNVNNADKLNVLTVKTREVQFLLNVRLEAQTAEQHLEFFDCQNSVPVSVVQLTI